MRRVRPAGRRREGCVTPAGPPRGSYLTVPERELPGDRPATRPQTERPGLRRRGYEGGRARRGGRHEGGTVNAGDLTDTAEDQLRKVAGGVHVGLGKPHDLPAGGG